MIYVLSESATDISPQVSPAWRLDWLTPLRCRLILAALLTFGAVSHLIYLHHSPIDLSGDEAQYWDWSRNLDLSYYSKGPLIAYIIRASCAIFGETMPVVRYPAIVIGTATSVVIYLLTRKLFGSERLALGTVLLFHILPLFLAGGVLMTIDPPMFLCWGLATYFAAIAIFDRKWSFWFLVGLAIGIGSLAKYAAMLWFLGAIGFCITSGRRRNLHGCLLAMGIAIVCLTPVFVWNYQHDWVSIKHVARQTGVARGVDEHFNLSGIITTVAGQLGFMVGTQVGAVGPALAYLMVVAIIAILRHETGENRARLLLLAWIGLAYWGLNFVFAFLTKIQPNWPAPAYFTLLVLTAYFLGTRLKNLETWKPARLVLGAVITGIVILPIVHDTSIIYPILNIYGKISGRDMNDLDPMARLRGWRFFGDFISGQLRVMGPGTFILCDDYQQTAELAFYVEGHPKTYCAGPYFADPKRFSQYDMWPDRRLDHSSPLVGSDAIFIGKGVGEKAPDDIKQAFERVESPQILKFQVNGVTVRTFKAIRCYGFKGMKLPEGLRDF